MIKQFSDNNKVFEGEIEINIYDRPFDYRTVVKLCEIKNTIY